MRTERVAFLLAALVGLVGLNLAAGQDGAPSASRAQRVILTFGKDQFIPKAGIEAATGARFQSDFRGLRFLDEVSVIVLADIAHGSLDPILESRLADWVNLGGSLLVTGGNNAYGLGGYVGTSIGSILPLLPDPRDKTVHSFGPPLPIDQSHPVLAGVTLASMAYFNETKLAGDATLILEYRAASKGGFAGGGLTGAGRPFGTVGAGVPGGVGQGGIPNTGIGTINTEGGIQGGGGLPWPLLAERRLGAGTVLATSLDLNATGEWKDRDAYAVNLIRYLLQASRLPQAR